METSTRIKSGKRFPVVGIGASAGGLDAFKKLLTAIPENSGMAYVLVQHLSPDHESALPEILQKVTAVPVIEIREDIQLKPDHIYVVPAAKTLEASDGVLELVPRPEKNSGELYLPIDYFFQSLAEVHQEAAIGIVLSGTGSDGALGLKAIKGQGGVTFAQDVASAAFDGMPASAIQAGVVDFVLPPEKIPEKLTEIAKIIKAALPEEATVPIEEEEAFKQILTLLRVRRGTDFTYYKQSTIRRRILRRMALSKIEEPAVFIKYLRENKTQQDLLYQDLLIPVTSFFRDEKSFEYLCSTIIPDLLQDKPSDDPIRIWVAGCSTGEEAYSIAICIKECLNGPPTQHISERVQIYASDISKLAIAKARSGLYTKNDLEGVSPKRLYERFTKTDGHYRVNKDVREMCVFAVHNFLKDPPFGKMDLVSCRNVLIYMEPYLQKKALTVFHYALNPKGLLMIGKSETVGVAPDLFAAVAKNDKVYIREDAPARFTYIASQRSEQHIIKVNTAKTKDAARADYQKTADEIILRKYTPAGVIVDENLDVVHYRGGVSLYLEQPFGKPSHHLLTLAKPGLGFELRNLMFKVKKEKIPVIKENIPVQINGEQQYTSIEAIPLAHTIEPYYLILFHETALLSAKIPSASPKTGAKIKKEEKDLRIRQLEQELAQLREDMRGVAEEQEAANEELQSANEELLSSSEELQSLNEELESAKEELESSNEELTALNEEMISLNEIAATSFSYTEAVIASMRHPILVLNQDLRVKAANKAFYSAFRTSELETEHRLIYDLNAKEWDIPALRDLLERALPGKNKIDDFAISHTFSGVGKRYMYLNAREVTHKNNAEKLILLSIEDVTDQRIAEKALRETEEEEERFRTFANNIQALAWMADAEGWIFWYNDRWYEYTGATPEEMEGWGWAAAHDPERLPAVMEQWQRSIKTGQPFDMTFPLRGRDNKFRLFLTRITPVFNGEGKLVRWFGSNTDVHEMKKAEEQFRALADQAPMWVWKRDAQGKITYVNTSLLQYIGLAEDQILHTNLWNVVVHPEEQATYAQAYKRGNELCQPFEIECRVKNGVQGTYEWYHFKCVPVFEDGQFTGFIGVAINVNEQKKQMAALTASEERFRTLADALPQLIWATDEKGVAEFASIRWKEYTGLEPADENWVKIVHPDDLAKINQVWANGLATGKPYFCDVRLKSASGGYRWYIVNGAPVLNAENKIVKWVGAFTDFDTQKNFSHELENQVRLRTNELAAANQDLVEKNGQLEKANKELQSFAYVSSHDLQEPLRKIQTFAGLIDKNERGRLSDKGIEHFDRIRQSAKRMQQLIQDLLAFSRMSTAERIFEYADLTKMIDEIKAEFGEEIQEKGAVLDYPEKCEVRVIPFQFRQLLHNLIGNALKFSKPGVSPAVTIKCQIATGLSLGYAKLDYLRSYYHLVVSDNGIGFEAQFSEKIFDIFQRLHLKSEYTGTGVGLAIVKKIVENHQGFITAKGATNKGATFELYIPVG